MFEFRVGPFPVALHLSLPLVLAIIGYGGGWARVALWVGIGVASILLHELGHAVALQRIGREPTITLAGLGGVTASTGQPMSPGQSAGVSFAGPGAGLAAGLVILVGARVLVPDASGLLRDGLVIAIFANIGWSLFNLVPMLPLDGGHIMAAAHETARPNAGDRVPKIISIAVGGALAFAAFAFGQWFAAFIVAMLAFQNVQSLNDRDPAADVERVRSAESRYRSGDRDGALADLHSVLAAKATSVATSQAAVLAAWWHLEAGADSKARSLFERYRTELPLGLVGASLSWLDGDRSEAGSAFAHALATEPLDPPAWLPQRLGWTQSDTSDIAAWCLELDEPGRGRSLVAFQSLLLRSGRPAEAGHLAASAWSRGAPVEVAIGAARAAVRQGQGDVARQWIDAAEANGLSRLSLHADPELSAIAAQS